MFFSKFKKEKIVKVYSPLNAEIISLENVPDPVFSQKMLGDGFAFIPSNGEIVSPIEGEITNVFPTKHAIGFRTAEGLEFLLHIGLETVELKGEGFSVTARERDKVRVNDSLGKFDPDFIKEQGKEVVTVLVMPNFAEKVGEFSQVDLGTVRVGTEIGQISIK